MADWLGSVAARSPSRQLRDERSLGAFGRSRARWPGGLRLARLRPQDATPLAPSRPLDQSGGWPDARRSQPCSWYSRRWRPILGPGAQMSRLLWAVATLGLRPNPFAALLWWWTRVATTATGPLRQLQGDPRAAARAGAPASRLHDRRRRTGATGQRLWPQLSHHRRRPGRTRRHGARLDPAGTPRSAPMVRWLRPQALPTSACPPTSIV